MADEAIDTDQTAQTGEDTQAQDTQFGDVNNQDGGLRPIDHQIINRLKDVEKKIKSDSQSVTKTSTNTQSNQNPDERFERLELQVAGYKGEEVDFIMRNGGKSALTDPLVTGAIDTLRAKAKSQDATPSGTGKSYTYQKFGEQDLKKMSAEELEKIVPQ